MGDRHILRMYSMTQYLLRTDNKNYTTFYFSKRSLKRLIYTYTCMQDASFTAPQEVNFLHIDNKVTYYICKICYKSLFYLPQIAGYFIILYFSVQVIFTFSLKLVLHVHAHRLLERNLLLFYITHYRSCCSSLWNGECQHNTGVYDNLLGSVTSYTVRVQRNI